MHFARRKSVFDFVWIGCRADSLTAYGSTSSQNLLVISHFGFWTPFAIARQEGEHFWDAPPRFQGYEERGAKDFHEHREQFIPGDGRRMLRMEKLKTAQQLQRTNRRGTAGLYNRSDHDMSLHEAERGGIEEDKCQILKSCRFSKDQTLLRI